MRGGRYINPEEALGKVYDSRIMKRLWRYARPYLLPLALSFFFAVINAGGEVLLPYLTKIGIDQYIVFSGKFVDLSELSKSEQQEILARYFDRSVRLNDQQFIIKEGILDPGDRYRLIQGGALKTGSYYLVDLDRYSGADLDKVKKVVDQSALGFKPSVNPRRYVIEGTNLDALDADINALLRQPDVTGIVRLAMIYIGILVVVVIIMFLQMNLMTWIGQKIMFDIRLELFEHIERLPIQFFNEQPTGRLVTRVSNDVNVLNEVFTSILVEVFKNILMIVGIVTAMLLLAPRLAVITFSVLPFIIIATWFFKRKMRDAFRVVRAKIALINATLSEHISGMRVIQMFARENFFFSKFQKINHECYQANMHQLVVQSMFSPIIVLLENLGIGLILYYGGGKVVQNTVSLGTLVAFLSYVSMFFGPVRDIAEKFNIMQSAMASSERIFQILDKRREDEDERWRPLVKKESLLGEIEFKNVWFAYEEKDWVLKDVSFKVAPGQTIALVGATGSGKTTILNLLTKFFQIQRGTINIDGVNIDQYDRNFLRRNIAMVLQDVFLFSGDIARNIRLNEDSISDEEIRNVSRMVRADRFISRMQEQYHHRVEENGATLSQGQRQLISFARALAFDPKVLILDEATANIDSETELWIQEALQELLKSRTSVVVAHRLSTIKESDKIIVMHKGRIREMGDHRSLLAQKGIYYRLYELQFKHQETPSQTG